MSATLRFSGKIISPPHDEFCEVEGKLMREFLGDGIASQPAGEALEKLSGRTATYREACFA